MFPFETTLFQHSSCHLTAKMTYMYYEQHIPRLSILCWADLHTCTSKYMMMIVLYRRITSSEHALHLHHALSVLCNFNYRNALEAYNELKRTTTSKTQQQTTAHVALIACQSSAMLNSSSLMRHRRWMCSTGSQLYACIVSSSLNCTVETSYGDKCPTLPLCEYVTQLHTCWGHDAGINA